MAERSGQNARAELQSTLRIEDVPTVRSMVAQKLREAIMFENGLKLFNLPTTVPVLEGQTRVW